MWPGLRETMHRTLITFIICMLCQITTDQWNRDTTPVRKFGCPHEKYQIVKFNAHTCAVWPRTMSVDRLKSEIDVYENIRLQRIVCNSFVRLIEFDEILLVTFSVCFLSTNFWQMVEFLC